MKKVFVLFRDDHHLRCAHLELPRTGDSLLVNGRLFSLAGHFIHLSHITDMGHCLIGFVVDVLEQVSAEPSWRAWWDTITNRNLWDFWEAHVFLADPMPADWESDGASLVGGGSVFEDSAGDYVLLLPDFNGYCFEEGKPTEFWKDIGFPLSRLDVAVAT